MSNHRDFKDFIQDKFGTTIEFSRRINMSRQQAALFMEQPHRMKIDLLAKISTETETPICSILELINTDEL